MHLLGARIPQTHSVHVASRTRVKRTIHWRIEMLTDIQLIHEFVPMRLYVLLSRRYVVAHEQVEPLLHLLSLCRSDADEPAGARCDEFCHHLGIVLAESLGSLDGDLLRILALDHAVALLITERVQSLRLFARTVGDLEERCHRVVQVAALDKLRAQLVYHGGHEAYDVRTIDIHIRRDYYLVEFEALLVELRDVLRQFLAPDFDTASHDTDEVHDDIRCKNALQGRLLDVEYFAPDRHERLVLRVARSQQAAQSGIALADEELSSLRVLAAAVDELLDLVGNIRLLHELLLDRDALALGLLAAPLVDQYLLDYLVRVRLVLDEPYLQVGLDQVCQELLNELVVDRLLGLVLV